MKGIILIIFILCLALPLFAQNEPQQQGSTNQPEVIDLVTREIKVKVETPQVQLITKRIKPEFDEIKLDRSFKKELIGEDEKINLKAGPETAEYFKIDIEKLMKTLR